MHSELPVAWLPPRPFRPSVCRRLLLQHAAQVIPHVVPHAALTALKYAVMRQQTRAARPHWCAAMASAARRAKYARLDRVSSSFYPEANRENPRIAGAASRGGIR